MTMTPEEVRTRILQLLSDGSFHSGETLAQHFSLSRTAIANHIQSLTELGLDIYSVKGKGYALANPITLLEHSEIMAHANATEDDLSLMVLPIIDSTNTYLKQNIDNVPHGQVVIAEAQTAGRGRRGKQWVSPFGASLYLSMCWHFQGGYQQIGGLSLFVGVCVIRALQKLNVDGLSIKWPNDIYRNGVKLGGVLVEVEGQIGTQVSCIIGIGINVNLPDVEAQIDQPFTDLSDFEINRNQLCATIIDTLYDSLPDFEAFGLSKLINQWNELDVFYQKPVMISSHGKTQKGINLGIDASGALQLATEEGVLSIHGGEVSLRAQ
ncbi:bifunctional biotin--[acetyl-CoA-carboxylase] ligase/biotin operon repressor BirA [Alteromonas facilis]|uniref:bifunctional biotin--[acetyl-CoA-carboxylase] ligase/biotin operon repressor BirA n=1 Tax=Alteromonas facilis TaxID=2048004 RepID=UPI000C282A89|nr:bifunctional biotin--[acetyl-CoA-carboxylase] ligase/biotin operon repressor BirA [Alteromonas facilis]